MKGSTILITGVIAFVAYQVLKGSGGLGGALESGGEGAGGGFLGGVSDFIANLGNLGNTSGSSVLIDGGSKNIAISPQASVSPTPSAPVAPTNPYSPPPASTPTQQLFIGASPGVNQGSLVYVNAAPNQVPTSFSTPEGNWLNVSQIYGYAGY